MPDERVAQEPPKTILLVEDQLHLLTMTAEFLEHFGYDVIPVRTSKEALDVAKDQEPFDLLFTDILLPGQMNGFELAKEIRSMRPDVAVIYTSGHTEFTASDMGEVVAPLLRKPATPDELAQALSDALFGSRQS